MAASWTFNAINRLLIGPNLSRRLDTQAGKKVNASVWGHRELDHVLTRRRMAAQHRPGVLQRLQHLHGLVIERFARRRQSCRVRAAVHQVGAGPGFQGLDAA
jgi:hypothetical protein